MTIASEISRLQTDKECMRQAIIGKGVDVAASVSFDDYAACIAQIQAIKQGFIDLLVVGGGGGGLDNTYISGGGGAGGFVELRTQLKELCGNYCVVVGRGGYNCYNQCNGVSSCFGDIVAYGGGGGATGTSYKYTCNGNNGGSGGGGTGRCGSSIGLGGCGCTGQGNNGGNGGCYAGGGGGGAGGAGGDGTTGRYGGNGGLGKCSCISGSCQRYAGGGGGGGLCSYGCGCSGGGNGGKQNQVGTNATTYGSGGGGGGCGSGQCLAGCGCQGVVILRYKTDGSDGLLPTSTGGTQYTCGDYTIHCFTTNGTFVPVYR